MDDEAVRRLVSNCLRQDPAASAAEITYFTAGRIQQHRRNPSVQNLPGLLIHSVQEYFRPGSSELAQYRAEIVRRQAEGRELAQSILADPNATEEDRLHAEELLNSPA